LPCALARSSPALTRSWIIARSNSAKTPIIWNRALPAGVVVSMPYAGPQFLPLTTAYVSRGPTGRLKADRAHLSTGPSRARPRGGLLGVVPSPQPVALLASRRAISLAAYQAIASTIPGGASN
jgi:hypothetical protein